MKRGTAHLPLHGGKAPRWLFRRMIELAGAISVIVVREFGPAELLARMSDPFWFQAFGCVLGFDWHSSGVTTTVCGAMKEARKRCGDDMGLLVCGGKGGTSRKTPQEIHEHCETLGTDADALEYASRTSAKVDSAAVQDGYQLYQHTFFFTPDGQWCVVQQGMNDRSRYARRYHWLGSTVEAFTVDPHAAVCSNERQLTLNLVAGEGQANRDASAELARLHPDKLMREVAELVSEDRPLLALEMPARHTLDEADVNPKQLRKIAIATYERQPEDFETLLGLPGVGPKTLRSLSLMSELIYNAPASRRDPAAYSFAHGGKDGHPFPVDRATYDRNIEFLREALNQAKLGRSDKLHAFRRLGRFLDEAAGRPAGSR